MIVAGCMKDIAVVMPVMERAFDAAFGEAWTASQCAGMLTMPGSALLVARRDGEAVGFALSRSIAGECELLLLAVDPAFRRQHIGRALVERTIANARLTQATAVYLEARATNAAIALYATTGFVKVGERPNYYRGTDGRGHDAHTYRLPLYKN